MTNMGSIYKALMGKEDCDVQDDELYPSTFSRLTSTGSTVNITSFPDIWKTHQGTINAKYYGDHTAIGATLNAAVGQTVNHTCKAIYIDAGAWTIEADYDWSSYTDVYWVFAPGAYLNVPLAYTVTFPSPVHVVAAPTQQIFSGSGTVAFGSPGTVTPDWFSSTFQTGLVNAANSGAGSIDLVSEYTQTATATITSVDNLTIRGVPGHKITVATNDMNSITATTCDNLTLDNINIEGGWVGGAPGTNEHLNKLLLATSCDYLRVQNCTVNSLTLLQVRTSDHIKVVNNFNDTGIVAKDHPTGLGFYYNVDFRGCSDVIVSNNEVRNPTGDGIKLRSYSGTYGDSYVITGNIVDGAHNDDGIDIYDAGNRVVVAGNIISNCEKGINVKDTGLTGNSGNITITGNYIYGGTWHEDTATYGLRQNGLAISANNVVVGDNVIENIDGVGIHIGLGAGNILISNNIIRDISIGSADLAYGIWLKELGDGVRVSGGIIDTVEEYGILVENPTTSWSIDGVTIIDPELRGINIISAYRFIISNTKVTSTVVGALYGIQVTGVLTEESVIRDCEVDGFTANINVSTNNGLVTLDNCTPIEARAGTNQKIQMTVTVDLSVAAADFTVYTVPAGCSFIPLSVVARIDNDCAATNGDYWGIGVDANNRRTDFGANTSAAADNKHSANARLRWINSPDKTCQIVDATEVISLISVADTTDAAAKSNNIGGTAGDQATVVITGYLLSQLGTY